MSRRPRLKTGMALAAATVLLSACSVAPKPYTAAEVIQTAEADRQAIATGEAPITHPLDLADATARALKFNLEHRVTLMEQALAGKSFELAKMDMLPILAVDAGYTVRDRWNASTSVNIDTMRESLSNSTSEDKDHLDASARFSFNLLDFGVSYMQARQESNRFLISQLARKKSQIALTQKVRTAYWRAAALQDLSGDIDGLIAEAQAALKDLETVRDQRLRPPLQVLEDIRGLTDTVQQLETLRQSVSAAMVDLATLIAAVPGSKIPLAVDGPLPDLPAPSTDFGSLELLALANSPEYGAQLYNLRIDRDEAHKSILRLLPGVDLFASASYDTNSYLTYNYWNTVGARVNWNIMRLLAVDEITDHDEARRALTEARRLAANVAAVTLYRVSHEEYRNALARLEQAEALDSIDQDIQALSQQAAASRAASPIERIQTQLRALRSKVASRLAYAEAQQQYGAYLASLGLNPVPVNYQAFSTRDLAAGIRNTLETWRGGRLPVAADVDALEVATEPAPLNHD